MKIGIITFHASLNYGSALQAFALQEFLAGRGHDVSIVDFRSLAQRRLYPAPICFNSRYNAKCTVRRLMGNWGDVRDMYRKRRAFAGFMDARFNLTRRRFRSEKALAGADWSEYDMIVSGSDQIWNLRAEDASPAYFLNFTEDVRKVAYAPSLGPRPDAVLESLSVLERSMAKDWLSGFETVSVRERKSADALADSGLLEDRPSVMPDPVLLHDGAFYRDAFGAGSWDFKDYVLLYSPGRKNAVSERLADEAVRRDGRPVTGKRIVRVADGSSAGSGQHETLPCGPDEFVRLVAGASCTVGTSFHLMVFSMLLGKDFLCPDVSSDSRKVQLLSDIGLPVSGTFFPFSNPALRPHIDTALARLRSIASDFFSSVGL